ncbi:MAG: XRE family transcriptional regulator [Treponema sp.]|nr:XRE family transcriptional regulator [Treponema sp.]
MNEEIKAVADRLIGLREIMDVSQEEAAAVCGISVEQYKSYESGEVDIPVGILQSMSKKYGIDLGVLISGQEPHMHFYCLTKKDKGLSVDRRKDYKYQALAAGFQNRKADPFIVSITPEETKEIHFNSHPGHEFEYMIEGSMKVVIDGKELILAEGDSLYFDSSKPHGMQALNGKNAKFLAVIM